MSDFNPLKVVGPLTDVELRAVAVPVSGAFFQGTQPVSGNVAVMASATVTGSTMFRNVAVTNIAVAVKASSGRVYGINILNPGTSLAYLHFYNAASGSVNVGVTTPVKSLGLPSNASSQIGLDAQNAIPWAFGTAITIAASTTPTGGLAPVTALVVNIDYA